jgi:hypothetical protein
MNTHGPQIPTGKFHSHPCMWILKGPSQSIQTKKNQSLQVDLALLPSPSSSSPSSFTGVGTGSSSQSRGQGIVGSGTGKPVYSGLLIAGSVMGVGFSGGIGNDQLGVFVLLLGPGPEVKFHVSGGPFVIRGHGGSVSVLVWISPPCILTVVTYGGKSRLYVGWKKPVVSPLDMFTFQKSIDVTVSGGGVTVIVLTVPDSSSTEVV